MGNVSNYGAGWSLVPWATPRPDAPEPDRVEAVDEDGNTLHLRTELEDGDYLHGVQITDPDGVTYRCLVEVPDHGAPYLSRLEIVPARAGQRVNRRFLAAIDADLLARMARDFLAEFGGQQAARRVVLTRSTAPRAGRGNAPDLQELADRYNAANSATEFRQELVHEYRVSAATVGRWLTRARERGYLPEATVGRPPKLPGDDPNDEPDDDPSPSTDQ